MVAENHKQRYVDEKRDEKKLIILLEIHVFLLAAHMNNPVFTQWRASNQTVSKQQCSSYSNYDSVEGDGAVGQGAQHPEAPF